MADDKPKSPDEQKLKDLSDRMNTDLQTSKKYMDPIHQLMDKYYSMYRNRWTDNNQDFQVSDLYAYVETVVPILTNNRVRATVHSDYPDYIKHADGIADILDHTYDINDWDYKSQKIARMAEIYRSAIAYTGFDADYKNGSGKLDIKNINMRWCYLDPAPTEFEESGFFFYVEPKRQSEVVKMYPKKKQEIIDSVGKSSASMGSDQKGNNWFKSWVNTMKNWVTFSADSKSMNRLQEYQTLPELTEDQKRKNSVAFIHYWYRDDDDKWRCSYWADDVLLEDMPNPFWHERLPYDIYNPTDDILSTMGVPMGEHIENLNYEKNVMMQYIVKSAERAVDPILIFNTAMGIKDPQALREKATETGTLGLNNPDMVPLSAIAEYFVPPPLPNYVLDLPDRFSQLEDRLTGVNDSFRGMSDATSGKEVQLKQEAAYTRIKTKIDNFERFNKSIAEKIIVNAMQFYKETRAFRIKGDYTKYADMQGQEDAPFEVQPIQKGMEQVPQQEGQEPTQEPVYDRTEFFMYANPNEWTNIVDDQGEEAPQAEGLEQEDATPTKESAERAYKILQFTVEIEAGSSLPTSRMARKEEALELAKMQMIDQEAVLDSFDWPKRDDIIKRMKEAQQAQMQQQQQMQEQQAQMQAQQQQAQQQQQMEMKQMEMQAKQQEQAANHEHQTKVTQMNNDAKGQPTQGDQQPQQPDIAGGLDKLRQADPRLANLSDEEIMSLIA
ncbi:hypothetical protein QFZ77_002447 [Paenibacillus sp. V4I3]|uniref:portal protein n=1 Tax=Paenibacillus sp. V4I3 TaxID=3042305 RepID=UPI00277DAC48|nr:hypothetical protein [Paenibacillus sp. V4I3]MDQ0873788.1 hypothetical protein [Paenibacillus sp. V4I3]